MAHVNSQNSPEFNFGPTWPFGNNDGNVDVNQQLSQQSQSSFDKNGISIANSTINVIEGSPTTATTADPCVAVCQMLQPEGPWTFVHDALNGGCVCED